MGSTPEELNTEIAGTRQTLSTDLDALQDRVSPQAIVDRRKAAVRSKASDVRSRIMGAADSAPTPSGAVDSAQSKIEGSPLAAGAVAFFAGMLVSAALPASKAEVTLSQKAIDTAQEQGVTDAVKSAGQDMAGGLKESADHAVHEIKDSAQESVAHVQNEGQSSVDTVRAEAQH